MTNVMPELSLRREWRWKAARTMSAPIQDVLQLYPVIFLLGQEGGKKEGHKHTPKNPGGTVQMLGGPNTTQEVAEPAARAPNLPRVLEMHTVPAPGAAEQRGKAPE